MGMLIPKRPNMNRYLLATLVLLCVGVGAAQTSAPAVSYSSISELNQLLNTLQQTSQAMQDDLSHLRIEKWKTDRSEEHTSELQSPCNLVCRLLLEKKKNHRKLRKHRATRTV